jgi:hypothetical protein
MKDLPTPPPIVLVGGTTATRSAWAAAWSEAGSGAGIDGGPAPALHTRDVRVDPPTAADPAPALCLLLGGDGDPAADADEAAARQALQGAGWAYSVLRGPLADQLDTARRAWLAARREPLAEPTRWRHVCGRCGDGDCERALFDRRHVGPTAAP